MKITDLKKFKLPDSPGVYFFKRTRLKGQDDGEILYIGKATSLKDRVRSYFSNDVIKTRGPLIVDMVTQANNLEFIKTDSVLEALILEAELIKKHKPIYNTKEKDNKSYSFVVITKDQFPRVFIERGRTLSFDTKKYNSVFGPFPSQNQLKEALNIIRKIFPFLSSKDSSNFYKQIGLEPEILKHPNSPGLRQTRIQDDKVSREYKENIRNIKLFLKGKKKEIIKKLKQEMRSLAKTKEFELAAKRRNQIFALEHLNDVSLIKHENTHISSDFRIESFDVAHMQGTNSVGVMTVIEDNEIKKSEYKKFILRKTRKGDDVGGLKEILERRLAHAEWTLPNLIVVDGGKGQLNMAKKVLKDLNIKIHVVGVVKDEKHKPKDILGLRKEHAKYKRSILIANNESHRFAIEFYRKKHSIFPRTNKKT